MQSEFNNHLNLHISSPPGLLVRWLLQCCMLHRYDGRQYYALFVKEGGGGEEWGRQIRDGLYIKDEFL